MNVNDVQNIMTNPKFQDMVRKKGRLSWGFSLFVFLMYVIYITCLGAVPHWFAVPIAEGLYTTWGIIVGILVIVLSFVVTGLYVYKANGEFDKLTKNAIDDVLKGEGK
ncbi:DUF485 domain-containing protein [Basilea psittacipulmonis]|uniref:DUF485 domain-containing protein n=1 Tax=Basilea psittacipulmonis DSM 24701 TaxID=1072685 RepID=A0A077DDP0_9BURK|nr:DUF485 domain-containing protein [Basilea psittacipulmonis]AIL32241.1 hypothetical protein IX83_01960 [Basilea psittacipulmonis DSM 24701]